MYEYIKFIYLFLIITVHNGSTECESLQFNVTTAVGDHFETNCTVDEECKNEFPITLTQVLNYGQQLSLFQLNAYIIDFNVVIKMNVYKFDDGTVLNCNKTIKNEYNQTIDVRVIKKLLLKKSSVESTEPKHIYYDPGNLTIYCDGHYLYKVDTTNKVTESIQLFDKQNCITIELNDKDDRTEIFCIKFHIILDNMTKTKICERQVLNVSKLHLKGSEIRLDYDYNKSTDWMSIPLIISAIVICVAIAIIWVQWWRRRDRIASQNVSQTDEDVYEIPHPPYVNLHGTATNTTSPESDYVDLSSEVQYADLEMMQGTLKSFDVNERCIYSKVTGILMPNNKKL
ncbi:uncharacterized protein LOC113514413 [Galleria mellonella]|uniref:Uncharacterized protein LOC113514413 n=1 Tax=Galleria mellonella TaxID=7137 RepID=A0A6J1WQH2_GALME|nr:uncharacterized protein LOC113514413 [Galleria mellonella]